MRSIKYLPLVVGSSCSPGASAEGHHSPCSPCACVGYKHARLMQIDVEAVSGNGRRVAHAHSSRMHRVQSNLQLYFSLGSCSNAVAAATGAHAGQVQVACTEHVLYLVHAAVPRAAHLPLRMHADHRCSNAAAAVAGWVGTRRACMQVACSSSLTHAAATACAACCALALLPAAGKDDASPQPRSTSRAWPCACACSDTTGATVRLEIGAVHTTRLPLPWQAPLGGRALGDPDWTVGAGRAFCISRAERRRKGLPRRQVGLCPCQSHPMPSHAPTMHLAPCSTPPTRRNSVQAQQHSTSTSTHRKH